MLGCQGSPSFDSLEGGEVQDSTNPQIRYLAIRLVDKRTLLAERSLCTITGIWPWKYARPSETSWRTENIEENTVALETTG